MQHLINNFVILWIIQTKNLSELNLFTEETDATELYIGINSFSFEQVQAIKLNLIPLGVLQMHVRNQQGLSSANLLMCICKDYHFSTHF